MSTSTRGRPHWPRMKNLARIAIRPLTPANEPFLWEMLYQALYVPPGAPPLPRAVLRQPEISRYVENWGRTDDEGFSAVAEATQQPVGAAWIRLLTGARKGYWMMKRRNCQSPCCRSIAAAALAPRC